MDSINEEVIIPIHKNGLKANFKIEKNLLRCKCGSMDTRCHIYNLKENKNSLYDTITGIEIFCKKCGESMLTIE